MNLNHKHSLVKHHAVCRAFIIFNMNMDYFKNIESGKGNLNFNQKYRPNTAVSANSVDLGNVSENYSFTHFGETAVKVSQTPNAKALKLFWTVLGILICVAAIVSLIVCLVIFVGNKNNDDSPQHPGHKDTKTTERKEYKKTSTLPTTRLDSTLQETAPTTHTTGDITSRVTTISTSASLLVSNQTDNTAIVTSTTPISATSSSGVGTWSVWGTWSLCAVTCGDSVHTRYRTCVKSAATDQNCVGNFNEQEICSTTTCPVYGVWTTWESWTNCDATCGGGTQSRSRICTKVSSTDIDCVGRSSRQQTCNNWNCPDCSQVCTSGVLNSECDACECTDLTVKGLVINTNGAPLQNVTISHQSAPQRSLTETKENGSFELVQVCSQDQVVLHKDGYQDAIETISSTTITITMKRIEYPKIILQPKSRIRLQGESVTFCCNATGNPAISSYEWLQNGNVLDEVLYPDGSTLTMPSLRFNDSGSIVCRANSPVGAVFSDIVSLVIRESSSDFCSDALAPFEIDLPSDCIQSETNSTKIDIGQCAPKSCRKNISNTEQDCSVDKRYCCITQNIERKEVQCSGYSIPIYVTTSCACGECGNSEITIKGKALGLSGGLPLRFGSMFIDGASVGRTGLLGDFSFAVPHGITRVAITFKDDIFKQFIDTLKIIRLNPETSGTLYVNVRVIEKGPTVDIDSTSQNTLQLGDDGGSDSVASLTLPANSIFYPNGSRYDGTVKASVTFFDPRNSSGIQNAPGEFSFIDQEGQTQNLQSFGVFSLILQDTSGSSLQVAGEAEIELDASFFEATSLGNLSDAKLWGLNPDTGIWEEAGQLNLLTSKRRKKRSNTFLVGQLEISAYTWANMDVFYSYRTCYFKAMAYDGLDQLTNFMVRTIYATGSYLVRYREHYVSSDNSITGPCGERFLGYIEAEKNGEKLVVDAINPGLDLNAINITNYNVTQDGRSISTYFLTASGGPFFSNAPSSLFENHFRFLLQEPTTDYSYTTLDQNFLTAVFNPAISGDELWYPPTNSVADIKYRTCFLKVGTINANENLKYRVTSRTESGKLLGIREKSVTNGSACIEYRCSVPNPDFTKNVINDGNLYAQDAFNSITVSPVEQICTVVEESSDIRSQERSNMGLTNEKTNMYQTYFEANIPKTQNIGIYHQDTSDYDSLDVLKTSTIKECYSGIADSSNPFMFPDAGLAVRFQCL